MIRNISMFALPLLLLGTITFFLLYGGRRASDTEAHRVSKETASLSDSFSSSSLPQLKILSTDYHIYQSFNNCAPAALSMALSYYGVRVSQEELRKALRPFNNPQGKNDDKSTPPDELALKAEEYGLIPYYRGGGDIELLKRLIALDLPVIVRTLLYADKDYAHYRIIKGYDDIHKELIQDDSLEGKNLRFSYEKFNALWKPFNTAYLVLTPPEKQSKVEEALGESVSAVASWQRAEARAEEDTIKNPLDTKAWFNLAVARYYTGDYEGSVAAFEEVQYGLPHFYLWYQVEPIRSYFALGNYDRVFEITDSILKPDTLAFSELYMLRGESYLRLGNRAAARAEFEKAVYYNTHYRLAEEALKKAKSE